KLFLIAGGRLTFGEWGELLPAERAAFVVAGRAWAAEQAAAVGVAVRDPLAVYSAADGGDLRARTLLREAVRRAASGETTTSDPMR
ncbi:MAG: hypothetical protein AAB368_11195, partial [bacterium]